MLHHLCHAFNSLRLMMMMMTTQIGLAVWRLMLYTQVWCRHPHPPSPNQPLNTWQRRAEPIAQAVHSKVMG